MHPGNSAEKEIGVDGFDALDELLHPVAERVGVSAVDQVVEDRPLEDPPPRRRRELQVLRD